MLMEDTDILGRLQTELNYFQSVVQYLDSSGNLDLVKGFCEKYKTKSTSLVYTFKLLIDPGDLLEVDAKLGNLLLLDPVLVSQIFQEVIHKAVHVLKLVPEDLSLSQVSVILRLASLPAIKNVNTVENVTCLTRVLRHGGFCILRGIVTGVTAVSQYTQSARYFCRNEDCKGSKGNHFIRVHTPGASEAQTIRNDFRCTFCFDILKEEKSSRILSDRLVAEFIPEDSLTKIAEKSRAQVVSVNIRDDLTKKIEVGQAYDIIGLVTKNVLDENICPIVEANNVQKVTYTCSMKEHIKYLTANVRKLYKDRRESPWSFVLSLAYYFGGYICPPGSYFNLKLVMLLSLMSLNEDQCQPVHLLAVSRDTHIVSRLLRYGMSFCRRGLTYTSGNSLTGRVIPDHYKIAVYFIEGGQLQLAYGGVCYVGDTGRLKKTDTEKLQSVLAGGRIVIDVGSKFTGGLPQQVEQALRCCVWGYSDSLCQKKHQNSEEGELFYTADTGDTPKLLLDSFSILCFTDCGDKTTQNEMCETVVQQTLASSMTEQQELTETELPLKAEDFEQLLKIAGQLKPKMRKEAEKLIHRYYLACRKSRSSDMSASCVPVSAYHTMLSLAYSHARLALRSEVTVGDALMAIRLYEESLTARFGLSVIVMQPQSHVSHHRVSQCLGPENDKMMQYFHGDLLKFCSVASGCEE